MDSIRTKRNYNRLLVPKTRYYNVGGLIKKGNTAVGGIGSLGGAGVMAGAGILGQIGGSAIAGGLQSGAGSAISGVGNAVGDIVGAIPGLGPIAGGIVKLGSGLIGGLTSRMFGSKMNKENIAKVEGQIDALNSFTSDASDFDSFVANAGNAPTMAGFSNSFIGKDGWFSSKAKKKARALRQQMENALAFRDNSLANNAENLVEDQADTLLANYSAFGGELNTQGSDFTNGIILIGNGGTHEQNPNEGVLFGVDREGVPNLVEEGEVVFRDYVFSNRIKVPKKVQEKHKLKEGLTFAEAAQELAKESEERPNDPISINGLEFLMGDLMSEQEMIKSKREKNKYSKGGRVNRYVEGTPSLDRLLFTKPTFGDIQIPTLKDYFDRTSSMKPLVVNGIDTGFKTPKTFLERYSEQHPIKLSFTSPSESSTSTNTTGGKKGSALANLRYIPALGAASGVTTDLLGVTNKPDYEPSNMILQAANSMGSAPTVRFNPIGNYLTYNPLDRDYYINKLNAQSGATRRAIGNSGASPMAKVASLLAGDASYLTSLGSLARQAEEYNAAQRERVEGFNRATNQYNSEGSLKADIANAESRTKARSLFLDATARGAQMRQAAKDASDAARSANLTNLFDSLGNIGWEEYQGNMINSNRGLLYGRNRDGSSYYKGAQQKHGGYLLTARKGRRK